MKKVAYVLLILLVAQLTRCYYANVNKYEPINPPDHGQRLEINGEKFRIIYIGGVRFRFPDNNTFVWASLSGDGIHIHLDWPNIPPGKVPETKYIEWLDGKIRRNNQVEVQVIGKEEPIQIDTSKAPGWQWRLSSSDYIVRDNLELGLRTFVSNDTSKALIDKGYVDYAYALTNDATEPWGGQPVVVSNGFIHFNYAPKIKVRIIMMGWSGGYINPNWKSIYLGVIETLNKYREEQQ